MGPGDKHRDDEGGCGRVWACDLVGGVPVGDGVAAQGGGSLFRVAKGSDHKALLSKWRNGSR